jgi:hypothetical protein
MQGLRGGGWTRYNVRRRKIRKGTRNKVNKKKKEF